MLSVLSSTKTISGTSGNSFEIEIPDGAQNGDIVLVLISRITSDYVLKPLGWKLISYSFNGSDRKYVYATKINGEAINLTWSWPDETGAHNYKATSIAITGCRINEDIYDTINSISNIEYTTDNNILRASSINIPIEKELLLFLGYVNSVSSISVTNPSTPDSFIDIYEGGDTSSLMWHYIYKLVWNSSGYTGNVDGTISNNLSTKHAFVISLKNNYDIQGLNYDNMENYKKYTCMTEPYSFPQGGPYASQDIDISKLKTFKTPKGIVNLDKILTVNSILNEYKYHFENNFTEFGFLRYEYESGNDLFCGQDSEFVNDKSVKFNINGDYVYKENNGPGRDDIAIELIFKPTTENTGNILRIGTTTHYISVDRYSSNNIVFKYYNITYGTVFEFYSSENSVNDNLFYHIMIFLGNRSGDNGSNIFYNIIINGQQDVTGEISNSDLIDFGTRRNQFSVGYNSDYYITLVNYWTYYNWFSNESMLSISSERYNKYINGNEDYYGDIPISAYTWGDGFGCIPIICYQNLNDEWNLLLDGTTGENFKEGVILNGIKTIRLFSKYERTSNRTYFDDIDTIGKKINFIEIPKKYKRVIRRVIAQSKPLGTWAILLIKWI